MRRILAMAACLLVAACEREPTEAEIRGAVERRLADTTQPLLDATGPARELASNLVPTLKSVRKLACSKAERGGFYCDVEIVLTTKVTGDHKTTSSRRFVRTETGWVAVDQ